MESDDDKFYVASEDAMNAIDVALVPGNFLVDALPIRTSSGLNFSVQTESAHSHDSQIRSRMVPWSWFQEVRKNCEGGY